VPPTLRGNNRTSRGSRLPKRSHSEDWKDLPPHARPLNPKPEMFGQSELVCAQSQSPYLILEPNNTSSHCQIPLLAHYTPPKHSLHPHDTTQNPNLPSSLSPSSRPLSRPFKALSKLLRSCYNKSMENASWLTGHRRQLRVCMRTHMEMWHALSTFPSGTEVSVKGPPEVTDSLA
jgi:hypothetical protein